MTIKASRPRQCRRMRSLDRVFRYNPYARVRARASRALLRQPFTRALAAGNKHASASSLTSQPGLPPAGL
jgi:hypothetical protein